MKNVRKLDVKKAKAKDATTQKARRSLSTSGVKAVVGCPELHFKK